MQAKTDLFPPDVARLAEAARVLSHPARLAILQTLAERGACVCGEVVDEIPLAQATVSQHIKALKDAGLVRGDVEGPRSCYCLNTAALRDLADSLSAFLDPLTSVVAADCDAADAGTPSRDGADCC